MKTQWFTALLGIAVTFSGAVGPRLAAQTVGEICSSDVVTISPTDPVSTAADVMSDRRLHALPVVEGRKLVGIVSRIDIIRNLVPK